MGQGRAGAAPCSAGDRHHGGARAAPAGTSRSARLDVPQCLSSAGAGALHPHQPRSPGRAGPARGGEHEGSRGKCLAPAAVGAGSQGFPSCRSSRAKSLPTPQHQACMGKALHHHGGLWARLGRGREGSKLRAMRQVQPCRGKRGSGSMCGVGAAWPEAGAALGCCCPKPLHPTASKPHGPWWPRGGCRGCWRRQRWEVSSWHPWQTLFSPEMPKGRRRPVLSLRL